MRKKENSRPTLRFLIPVVVLCICILTACIGGSKNETKVTPTPEPLVQTGCEVHILSVGKADAILILADGRAMLIDAGYRHNAAEVVSYIRERGVSKLDYVILTHGDKDHVGGMAEVLKTFEIGQVLLCPKKENSEYYSDMVNVISQKNISFTSPAVGTEFTLGGAKFQTLSPGPKALKEGSDNDASIAVRLVYGSRSFLLMGDALSTTEKELIDSSYTIRSDVLKTGHHGKNDATNKKFLKAVQPKYAIITCGETDGTDESGVPDTKVLELLGDFNVKTYRTDIDGTIVFSTDGTTLTCDADPQ